MVCLILVTHPVLFFQGTPACDTTLQVNAQITMSQSHSYSPFVYAKISCYTLVSRLFTLLLFSPLVQKKKTLTVKRFGGNKLFSNGFPRQVSFIYIAQISQIISCLKWLFNAQMRTNPVTHPPSLKKKSFQ